MMNALQKSASAIGLAGMLALTGCTPGYGPGWERDYPPVAYSRDLHPGDGSVYAIEMIRPEHNSGIGVGAIAGAVIGGIDKISGSLAGGFVVGFATSMLAAWLPEGMTNFKDAFVFVLVIAVLLFKPSGLLIKGRGVVRT